GKRMKVVYIDASPLGDPWLTGIGRYTARIALAISKYAEVRFFSDVFQIHAPRGLSWSHDQDLQVWARRVWRGRRVPLGNGLGDELCIYPCLRPSKRRFSTEISILHDYTPLVVPHTHTEVTRGLFQGFYAKTLLASDGALSVSYATKHDASWLCDFPQRRIV